MKKICFLILAALISTVSMAQTAKSVLDKAAANITVKEGVKANFRMTGGIGFASGTILIKGKKTLAEVSAKTAEYEHNMMYMPIIDILFPKGADLFNQYMEAGEVPLAYEVCFAELNDTVRDCCKKVIDTGSKLWVNTLWPSLNGGYDDNTAFEAGDPAEIYDVILDLGTSIIQTDRPEMLIKYLEKKGRRK